MKKMILENIKELKKSTAQTEAKAVKEADKITRQVRTEIKKQYINKQRQVRGGFGLFKKIVFCFPVLDVEITPKRVEFLSNAINDEGGQIIQFKDKAISQDIDFLLCNPKMKDQIIRQRIAGKIKYKEIIDYSFIQDCLRDKILHNHEKYSIYVNCGEEEDEDRTRTVSIFDNMRKRVKLDKEESQRQKQEVILSEDEYEKKKQWSKEADKNTFLCQNATKDHKEFSMNKFICEELMKLQKIYQTQKDIGRKIAYLKAVSVIRSLDKQIESEKDLENIRGIGKKITEKIKQLMTTGRLQKLQKLQSSQKNVVCGQFCKIWGIGPTKALELFNKGIKSIEELKQNTDLLTKNQRIGLKYFDDFEKRIPREKVTRMFEFVKNNLAKLVKSIDDYNLQVCGSYRRKKQSCGDMDIIISRKDGTFQKSLLLDLILLLQKQKFLTEHLTFPKISENRSSTSYMGVCQFEDKTHHRIDIKYYPIEEYAYALLYFTGSGMFNRSMRLYATKVGLQLSDHGAIPRADKHGLAWTKQIPVCLTEADIFKYMGLDYKTPQERDV